MAENADAEIQPMEIEPASAVPTQISNNTTRQIPNKTIDKRSLMWIEKYRPASLNDLLSHKDIITTRMLI